MARLTPLLPLTGQKFTPSLIGGLGRLHPGELFARLRGDDGWDVVPSWSAEAVSRKETAMKPRIMTWILPVLLLGAAGCSSTTGGSLVIKPEDLGAFECVDRGAVASAPARAVLDLGYVRGEKRTIVRRKAKPLLNLRLCGNGKVPVSKTPALPTVAKGNPLIGPIDRPVADFFKDPERGELIRKNLRPFQKVYYIPPGPDEKRHESPPDPP